jgi:hypothetical protein
MYVRVILSPLWPRLISPKADESQTNKMAAKKQELSVISIKAAQGCPQARFSVRDGNGKYSQDPIIQLQFPKAVTEANWLPFLHRQSTVHSRDYVYV